MILLAVKRKILSKNLIGIALQNHVDLEKQQQAKTEPGSLVKNGKGKLEAKFCLQENTHFQQPLLP